MPEQAQSKAAPPETVQTNTPPTQWNNGKRQEQGTNTAQNNARTEASTAVVPKNTNAQAESAPAAPPQHVRPVNEKQVKTCIRVKYRGYKLFALLDTGSDITIAGRDVADRCGWELEERAVAPIKVATDELLVIDGVAMVPLRVGNKSTVTDVLVTRDINGLILGVDWMARQGPITWDFDKERVKFDQGEWIDLQKEGQSRKVRRIYVSQDTILPGSGQTNVDVRVTHKDMREKAHMGVLENKRVAGLARVYTGRSLIPPRFTDIKVPVLSAAESSQILPKGTDLGVVEVAEPLESVWLQKTPLIWRWILK